MSGFSKLFSSIITSTIWQEDDHTRILWLTMLATCDAEGVVEGSVPGLAHVARIPLDACRTSIEKLSAPDPDSRTKDHEGRRIAPVDGGWKILNYLKYRQKGRHSDRSEYLAMKQREYRSRERKCQQVSTLTRVDQSQPIAEAEADSAKKALVKPNGKPTPTGVRFARLASDSARLNQLNPGS